MDSKTVFVRTDKGNEEAAGKREHLSDDIRRALLMVDGQTTLEEIGKRAAPSLRSALDEVIRTLQRGGYIEDSAKAGMIPRMVIPPKMVVPASKSSQEGLEDLDFTSVSEAPTPEQIAAETAHVEAEAARKQAEQQAEAARKQAEQEAVRAREQAEAARLKAEQEAAKVKAELEAARAHAEAEAKARAEAELRARAEAAAARKRTEQQAEAARKQAEQEAARAREEAERIKHQAEEEARQRVKAERARLKAEEEAARAKAELEAARLRAEAEAKAREEAERRAREEAEAARKQAEQEAARAREEAERIRREAEEEAARARAELEAARAHAEAEAKAREEAERRAREEAEAARRQAEQEAEAARLKAEQEAARAREEAERIRREAEEEAARAKAELEAARLRAEAEAKAREEAERRAREEAEAARRQAEQEAEAARLKAEQEAAHAREEAERIRRQAEEEARQREEAERLAREEVEAAQRLAEQQAEAARAEREKMEAAIEEVPRVLPESVPEAVAVAGMEGVKPGKPSAVESARSTSATVLFLDMVGYTRLPVKKQIGIKKRFSQLLAECLAAQQDGDYIVLDTGDGAAIGFLHHPEDALEVAMRFCKAALVDSLKVRIGIHLGPINIVRDMNGQSNMLGDGINDAQRVMGFAGTGQIYVSRSYYDFMSRLSDEYAALFHYRGAQKDKHGRSHQLYELLDGTRMEAAHEAEAAGDAMPEIRLEPFSLPQEEPAPARMPERSETNRRAQAEAVLESEIAQLGKPVPEAAAEPAPMPASTEAATRQPHLPSGEEVEALAEAQAKTWAEAERRAQESAAAKAAADEAEAAVVPGKPKKSRVRRKPLPWGKIAAVLLVLALTSLFVLPLMLPAEGYATRVEQLLSARTGQPAQVGKLNWRILPTPRLEVEAVALGKGKQVQVGRMRADFAFSALFSSTRTINSLELEGVQVSGSALREMAGWLSQAASDPSLPVRHIGLAGRLEAQGFTLAGVNGDIEFDAGGGFSRAQLHAEENKYALNIVPAAGKLHTTAIIRGAALPLLPGWVFDELNLAGEMSAEEWAITDLDGRIAGGMLLGDARIGWLGGWTAEGNLVAKAVGAQNISNLLNGDLEAKGRFQMGAASLPELPSTARLEGEFVMRKGVINGIDIVETVRLRSHSSAPGGRTHFDELTGSFEGAQETFYLRQLVMKAGVMNASGAVEIGKRNVDGQLSAELSLRGGTGAVPLQLGGTLDGLTLHLR